MDKCPKINIHSKEPFLSSYALAAAPIQNTRNLNTITNF